MAKRFTDSGKWSDPWFRNLNPKMKLAWIFLLDVCDHAGIWKEDYLLMGFFLNATHSREEILEAFGENVCLVDDNKLFLTGFVSFQYGEKYNAHNKVHLSAHNLLKKIRFPEIKNKKISALKEGAWMGLASPSLAPKDKDKEKDKDMDMDKEREKDKEKDKEKEAAKTEGEKAREEMIKKYNLKTTPPVDSDCIPF